MSSATPKIKEEPPKQTAAKPRPNLIILNGDRDKGGKPIALGEGVLSQVPGFYDVITTHFATYDPAHPDLAASEMEWQELERPIGPALRQATHVLPLNFFI